MTNIEKVFTEIQKNGSLTNEQISELTGVSYDNVKSAISRLKKQEYLSISYPNGERKIEVIDNYMLRKASASEISSVMYKNEIYQEMLDIYMQDFRDASTLDDRLRLGREIRLIIEKL